MRNMDLQSFVGKDGFMRDVRNCVFGAVLAVAVALGALVSVQTSARAVGSAGAESGVEGVDLYRLYNPYTGEHFYTPDAVERASLVSVGWKYEGVGWRAVTSEGKPVYRLYNHYVDGGDHHYTADENEYDELQKLGWLGEGSSWNTVTAEDLVSFPVYRLYNPNAASGAHHYTTDAAERDALVEAGWKDEGTGWNASGRRRPLLDGSQPTIVEAARKIAGVPENDSSITYLMTERENHRLDEDGNWVLDKQYIQVRFMTDNFEKQIFVNMNQDGTLCSDLYSETWDGKTITSVNGQVTTI